MRLVGWALAVVGVVLLALIGAQRWDAGCPCIGGLESGQVLVALAAIIGLGLALIAIAGRRRWYRS